MKLIDNRINTLKEDLSGEIKKGSKMQLPLPASQFMLFSL